MVVELTHVMEAELAVGVIVIVLPSTSELMPLEASVRTRFPPVTWADATSFVALKTGMPIALVVQLSFTPCWSWMHVLIAVLMLSTELIAAAIFALTMYS